MTLIPNTFNSDNEIRFYCETLPNFIKVFPGGISFNSEITHSTAEDLLKPLKAAVEHANEIGVAFLPVSAKMRFRNYVEVLNNNLSLHLFSQTIRLFYAGVQHYPHLIENNISTLLNEAGKAVVIDRLAFDLIDECKAVLSVTKSLMLNEHYKHYKVEYAIKSKQAQKSAGARDTADVQ